MDGKVVRGRKVIRDRKVVRHAGAPTGRSEWERSKGTKREQESRGCQVDTLRLRSMARRYRF